MVRPAAERGFALLLALAISFLVAATAIVIGRALDTRSSTDLLELRVVKLRALTDAALAETMAHLDESPTFRGQPDHALGDGMIGSSVKQREDGALHVTANANWRRWAAALDADVRFDGQGRPHITIWKRTLRVGAEHPGTDSAASRLD